MGKRSDFKRRDRDFYPTPKSAVLPLVPHLSGIKFFDEPCAGDYRLVNHIQELGFHCVRATDLQPEHDWVSELDVFDVNHCRGDCFITNPPWPHPGHGGEPALGIALHLSSIAPTWLLLSADFAHNVYFSKLADRCVQIVSVGRVSWAENGIKGKDNAAWYLFDAKHEGQTEFVGRAA